MSRGPLDKNPPSLDICGNSTLRAWHTCATIDLQFEEIKTSSSRDYGYILKKKCKSLSQQGRVHILQTALS